MEPTSEASPSVELSRGPGRGQRLVVTSEHRFTRVDGRICSSILTYDRIWTRYLEVFARVIVLARVGDPVASAGVLHAAGGPGVEWIPLPHFVGPWRYLRHRAAARKAIVEAAETGDAFMLRVPGTVGTLLWKELRRRGRPYGVEVAADPHEVFAPGANRSMARPLFRRWFSRVLRAQCRDAVVAAYVTRSALQQRYPSSGWTCAYSDVELREADYATASQLEERLGRYVRKTSADEWSCLHIGTMAQPYKRQDALIRAVADCRLAGLSLRLRLVGSGGLEQELRELARSLGVDQQVEFLGELPAGEAIRSALDEADVFVLPSQTEGLPRVLLEAMARGVPCLATDVGGVHELLDASELISRADIPKVGLHIKDLVKDRGRLARLARLNVERARAYSTDVLRRRWLKCYSRLALESSGGPGVVARVV